MPATRRRIRVLQTTVRCPRCGQSLVVQVPATTRIRYAGEDPGRAVLTFPCTRHCGADVPVTVEDLRPERGPRGVSGRDP